MSWRTLVSKLSPLPLLRLRPLIIAGDGFLRRSGTSTAGGGALRSLSSLNAPLPNWSNRNETADVSTGCDLKHWLVFMNPPRPKTPRDHIIDSYIKTLAQVLRSEQEARMSIYSVSTRHYFAFGAKFSEDLHDKFNYLPGVRRVVPDSYLDVKNKKYGGEPFINGEAAPYDPKYHEWVRINARVAERSRHNGRSCIFEWSNSIEGSWHNRPCIFERSSNFERQGEAMKNQDAPSMQNHDFQSSSTPAPQQNDAAPTPNHDFNHMPNSNVPPLQPPPSSTPAYQDHGYQGDHGPSEWRPWLTGDAGGGGDPRYQGGNN